MRGEFCKKFQWNHRLLKYIFRTRRRRLGLPELRAWLDQGDELPVDPLTTDVKRPKYLTPSELSETFASTVDKVHSPHGPLVRCIRVFEAFKPYGLSDNWYDQHEIIRVRWSLFTHSISLISFPLSHFLWPDLSHSLFLPFFLHTLRCIASYHHTLQYLYTHSL